MELKCRMVQFWFFLSWWALGQCAVLPHHLPVYPPMAGVPSNWRPSAMASRSNAHLMADNAETYGYVDRFPPSDRINQQLVFGVPHRFTDNVASPYESLLSAAPSDYDVNYDAATNQYLWPAFYRMASEGDLNKRSMRFLPYDVRDLYDDESESAANSRDYLPMGLSPEDVVNFQKYVQRYFPASKDDWNGYDDVVPGDDSAFWNEEAATEEPVYNDEEAAIQLHSLIPSRPLKNAKQSRPSPNHLKEVQKKASPDASPTTAKPSVADTTSPSAGQKEEPMLRPPSPPRHPVPAPTTGTPPAEHSSPPSVIDSIKRIFQMRSRVQETESQSGDSRIKRFVTPEDSLLTQLHSLNKIKA